MLTLYGGGASQPSKAVWWASLMQELPFELCEVRLDQVGPDGAPAELNPTGQVPTILDGDFVLHEMPAILAYLCRKNGWNRLCRTRSSDNLGAGAAAVEALAAAGVKTRTLGS